MLKAFSTPVCSFCNLRAANMSYYAVANGRKTGIFSTWNECKNQVNQYSGAKYKKFSSYSEAQAFVDGGAPSSSSSSSYSGYHPYRSSNSSSSYSRQDYQPRSSRGISYHETTPSSVLNTQKKRVGSNHFEVDDNGYVNVWTDGACSKNGRNNAKAGIGAFFGFDNPLNISEPVDTRSTNNYAEIKAVTEAAKRAHQSGVSKLKINTDSKFLIQCANDWMPKWKSNGWKTSSGEPVINRSELVEMERELRKFDSIDWKHVRGHQGHVGNEMADQLARKGAEKH